MTPESFVDMIGLKNAEVVRKLSVRWPLHKPDMSAAFNRIEELGMHDECHWHGLRILAIELNHPWVPYPFLKDEDFAGPLKLIRDISKDPDYVNMFGKKVLVCYACSKRQMWREDPPLQHIKALIVMIGQSLFEHGEWVSLREIQKMCWLCRLLAVYGGS
jgi:hypothetical protein